MQMESLQEKLGELQEKISKELPEVFATKQDWYFLRAYEEYLYGDKEVSESLLKSTITKREEVLLWLKEENEKHYRWIKFLMFVLGY